MIDPYIIGVDKGSIVTNTSKGYEILSTVRDLGEDEIDFDNSKTVAEFNNRKLVIGGKGNFATDLMKAEHKNTPVLVYTSIAQSFKEEYIQTNLVLGLPIRLYARNKDKMKNLFHNQSKSLVVNENKKIVVIKKALVYPEAAAAFNNLSNMQDCLVIDFGGLSIDVALFKNGDLVDYSTYSMGLLKLYSKIVKKLNAEYDLSISEWEVKELLKEGIYIDGKKAETGVEGIIKSHINEIMGKIKLEYDLRRQRNIALTGGGSKDYYDLLKEHMPYAILSDNAKTDNAIGLEMVGKEMF